MNVPNSLSILRILLIFVFCAAFLHDPSNYIIAGAALILSALSDVLDGFFARRLNQITELGKWLDPIADKLTLGAVVVCMWLHMHDEFPIVTPLFAILIGKELVMAIGGLIVTHGRDEMIPAQWWGKLGTAVFYSCMIGIVCVSVFGLFPAHQHEIITVLVTLPSAAMLFALCRYIIFAVRIMKADKNNAPSDAE